ncbi:MAG: bifunctional diaminohydroxyphosphoribosylaminopyrimidine deaminase/5-amino-6-(5-phosphoribosylamino)uracil reductase RibD [Gammaproteobacteria bacterium]|nr:bifunctional diaminohydroxyphosphoribosylaminopyrimidine deaminase/5-amino-6-(5-phosphoribosylamino)uracil reductase RibD [Gammaproteobacteria bacterium]MDH3563795.1 bifunctional diaminohydroxyphosphoribosylaminopyrimidine deaminase/5-amino-6-(5-phosphoribosylamino)uracil reductase RibD [Gammaproteobacteria bacterium]
MRTSDADARFMARALQLARRGMYTTDPNPRVGCVIVKDGKIVGEGWHERAGQPHAEINALQQAGKLNTHSAGVYLTLEPCCHEGRTPPCTPALIKAGVKRVVAAMRDPNPLMAGSGFKQLEARGIQVVNGLMEREAEALNPGFISRMTRGRPYVRVKIAASLDGRTGLANGESKWITGDLARADVQTWRARSSAILTGVQTVIADDPLLTVRDLEIGRQPLRVVLDSRLRMPPRARMLRADGKTLIVTGNDDMALTNSLKQAGAEVARLPTRQKAIDLIELFKHLVWLEVNEVLVEAGATLCGTLLQLGLVDELIMYYAPHIMGSHERGMFMLPPLARMAERVNVEISDIRALGKDWRVIARVSEKQD